jgi:glucuronate isomerase
MKSFITENFLLETEAARELYFNDAAPQPIYDYHTHLPPQQLAENHRFRNLYEIWLGGDHYKWRAMRANGVAERFCTGDAGDYEKFEAFARTVPYTLRNPLYHWSHLELQRYFGIDAILDGESAPAIWKKANDLLATPELSVHGILEKNRVAVAVTTDDPTDSLDAHRLVRKSSLKTRIYPTFRPDKALAIGQPAAFNAWREKLGAVSNIDTSKLAGFLDALKNRHDFFHEQGGRLSDHGLESCLAADCDETEAARIFSRAVDGRETTTEERVKFGSFLMLFFGRLDAARGWTKQLHLGAQRGTNTRRLRELGPDTGFDTIGDFPQASALAAYLDRLDATNELPRTVIYNLNPADNYVFGAMIGNYQDGAIPGKIQFGSGWWFLDQAEGMTWQLDALSNLGLLRRFVGMLTDSRSFMSYPRHEYFRRILCNLLGRDIERGLLPRDLKLLGALVREVCFANARDYFRLELDPVFTSR